MGSRLKSWQYLFKRAGSFLKHLISMALQMGNAACVLGTVSDRDAFEEIPTYSFFSLKKTINAAFKKIYRSTAIVAGMSSLLVGIFVTGLLG